MNSAVASRFRPRKGKHAHKHSRDRQAPQPSGAEQAEGIPRPSRSPSEPEAFMRAGGAEAEPFFWGAGEPPREES